MNFPQRLSGQNYRNARDFIWAGGIEDTFVPQIRPGHRSLDEYELMGHYLHWREDLALCRDLGLGAVRWGVPWYRVEPEPGRFDWHWVDEVVHYLVDELKIDPIVDLVHYGCPFWLERSFTDKNYPSRVAQYAAAFAERYSNHVHWYTPLNEPIITALMCGMRGLWPPYSKGEKGYIRLMLQIARGIHSTVRAIRQVDADSIMVHVEATGLTRTIRDDLAPLAREEQHRGYLCFDLVTGRLTPDHLLFPWLLRNGAVLDELHALNENRIELDIVGMNFYPQWSTKQIYLDRRGRIAFRETEPEGTGFAELVRDYHNRYGAPVMITETSAVGSEELRLAWLKSSVATIKNLRVEGVPVIGYTWFPLFTMIDWRYRFGTAPLEDFYLELGLYNLNRESPRPRWLATPLVAELQKYVSSPEDAVGDLREQDAETII